MGFCPPHSDDNRTRTPQTPCAEPLGQVRCHPRRSEPRVGVSPRRTVRNELRPKGFEGGQRYLRRVVAASMAGTVVEWYEFLSLIHI